MAKERELTIQRRQVVARRNGRVKRPSELRLVASRHVRRAAPRRVEPGR